MDGLTFLGKLMEHHPLPVIIVSSLTPAGSAASIEALRIGAIDVIAKPGGPYSVGQVAEKLKQRIRGLRTGGFHLPKRPPAAPPSSVPSRASCAAEARQRPDRDRRVDRRHPGHRGAC